jgi:hypothetical protein
MSDAMIRVLGALLVGVVVGLLVRNRTHNNKVAAAWVGAAVGLTSVVLRLLMG